jgi:5-methylcytosine-specific restriction endonuclease McrA
VLLLHGVLEPQVRHAHATSQALVKICNASACHLHNVELACVNFHLRAYFKLLRERALQLFVQRRGLLFKASLDGSGCCEHIVT